MNGNIIQFALPPAGYVSTDVGSIRAVATASSDAATVSSIDITVPATAQYCDTAIVIGNIGAGSTITMGGPAGYTLVGYEASNFNNAQLGVWRKKLSSADAGQTLTITSSAGRRMAATIIVVADTSYDGVSSIVQSTGALEASLPTVTPSRDNALLLGIVASGTESGISDVLPPLHWTEENEIISAPGTSQNLINYVALNRVKSGAAIATYNYVDLVRYQGASANHVSITLAFTQGPDSGITVTVWNGTTRQPAKVRGVWDGTQIVCGTVKEIGN